MLDVPPALVFAGGVAIGAVVAANAVRARLLRGRARELAGSVRGPRVRVGLEVRHASSRALQKATTRPLRVRVSAPPPRERPDDRPRGTATGATPLLASPPRARADDSPSHPPLPRASRPALAPRVLINHTPQVAAEDGFRALRGLRVGVLTNPSGVMPSTLEHAVDVLGASPNVDLVAVFAPEHGFRGAAQAGSSREPVAATRRRSGEGSPPLIPEDEVGASKKGKIPPRVFDTYGKRGAELRALISESGVDAIAFDVQDVGARFYTYVWTLYDVMVACASLSPPVRLVVFDRPNPLGGAVIEGPVAVEAGCASFLARKPIAVRHGMTLGELARMFEAKFLAEDVEALGAIPRRRSGDASEGLLSSEDYSWDGIRDPPRDAPSDRKDPPSDRKAGPRAGPPSIVTVVRMRRWRRRMSWADTGLPWTPPSPNVPRAETALAYVGSCLLEGTNACEGRGTTSPFELFGAEWADERWAEALTARRENPAGAAGAGAVGGEEEEDPKKIAAGGAAEGVEKVGRRALARASKKKVSTGRSSRRRLGDRRPARVGGGGAGAGAGAAPAWTLAGARAPAPGRAARYRAARFVPTWGASADASLAGAQCFPLGIENALFREGAEILAAARVTYPDAFAWREGPDAVPRGATLRADRTGDRAARAKSRAAVFKSPTKATSFKKKTGWKSPRREASAPPATLRRAPFVDLLAGTPRLREAIDAPVAEVRAALDAAFAEWDAQLREFARAREPFLLYD